MPFTQKLLLLCMLSTLAACASQKPAREFIESKPKVEPLSASVLQAMQPNSTEVLKRADQWYKNSGLLLDSVTNNSGN